MIPDSLDNSGKLANGDGHDFLAIARRISEAIGGEFFFTLTDQLAGISEEEPLLTFSFRENLLNRQPFQILAVSVAASIG